MDLFACSRSYLFFRFLFVGLSDSWANRPAGNSSGIGISRGGCAWVWAAAFLVRAYVAMVFERIAHTDGPMLDWYCCLAAGSSEYVAARYAGGLLWLLSFLCRGGKRFFRLSIRWHVVGGRLYFALLCAWWIFPRLGSCQVPSAREFISFALGMVPYLLRVGRRKACQRRSAMAPSDSHGRVLSEWPAAHLDRLVRAASTALVSRVDGCGYAGDGTVVGVDDVSASALADCMFPSGHTLADCRHSDGELCIFELSRFGAWLPVAG